MKVKEVDQLFALMHGISQNYLSALDDDNEIRQATEWFDKHDKEVFTFKQSIVDYLHQPKEYLNEEFSRSSLKSKYSHSRRSYASGSSNRSQFAVIKKMADVDFTTMLCEPELVMITTRTVLFAYINLGISNIYFTNFMVLMLCLYGNLFKI